MVAQVVCEPKQSCDTQLFVIAKCNVTESCWLYIAGVTSICERSVFIYYESEEKHLTVTQFKYKIKQFIFKILIIFAICLGWVCY